MGAIEITKAIREEREKKRILEAAGFKDTIYGFGYDTHLDIAYSISKLSIEQVSAFQLKLNIIQILLKMQDKMNKHITKLIEDVTNGN